MHFTCELVCAVYALEDLNCMEHVLHSYVVVGSGLVCDCDCGIVFLVLGMLELLVFDEFEVCLYCL